MQLNLFKTKDEEKIDIYYSTMTPLLEQIVGLIKGEKPTIYGTVEGEKSVLVLDDILYFDTVDRRNYAYTKKTVYQISQSITALSTQLEEYGFTRVNKANLVNIYHIAKIKPEANMRIRVILDNGDHLQINRAYKRSFEAYLRRVRGTK